jgi:hypothetical protein
MKMVVVLSSRNGGSAQQRNLVELHCEEADS